MICPNCQELTAMSSAIPNIGIEYVFYTCKNRCFQFHYENEKLIFYYLKMEADGFQIWASKYSNRTAISHLNPTPTTPANPIMEMHSFIEVELKDIQPLIKRLLNLKAFS